MFFISDNYPTNSNDSFCSTDISLDGSSQFEALDEAGSDSMSVQNSEQSRSHQQQQHHHHGHHQHHPVNSNIQINPIDKLYLMQNSYFNSEH